jgi:uncharacterized Tic20 family protein
MAGSFYLSLEQTVWDYSLEESQSATGDWNAPYTAIEIRIGDIKMVDSHPIPQRSSDTLFPPVSQSDERTLAALAHLSVLLTLCTGWIGMLAALIVYLVYRERSKYIEFHALQSLLFQVSAWILPTAIVIVLWITSFLLLLCFGLGLLLMPFAILASLMLAVVPLAAAIYGIIGAVECGYGRDFRYWVVGAWTEKIIPGGKIYGYEKTMDGASGTR